MLPHPPGLWSGEAGRRQPGRRAAVAPRFGAGRCDLV